MDAFLLSPALTSRFSSRLRLYLTEQRSSLSNSTSDRAEEKRGPADDQRTTQASAGMQLNWRSIGGGGSACSIDEREAHWEGGGGGARQVVAAPRHGMVHLQDSLLIPRTSCSSIGADGGGRCRNGCIIVLHTQFMISAIQYFVIQYFCIYRI